MSSLLQQDYNAKNYDNTCWLKKQTIDLPQGKLGIEIEDNNGIFTVAEIYNTSKMKGILNIGDEIYSLNDKRFKNMKDLEIEFFKNIVSKRTVLIYR
jgi:C-terminal processing protease CtpA/Prc